MLMHFHAYVPYIQYIFVYLNCLELFWLSLSSLSLSLLFTLMRQWHQNVNLLHPETLFCSKASSSSDHTPSSIRFRDEDARKDFSKNFSRRGVHSECESFWRILSTLTYPMSFTVGVGSHCVTSRSYVLSCWSRSFTPTCMELILQYLFFILASRYAHCCHTGVGIRCALCPEGRASWLPWLWASEDCVQRRDDFRFLRASRGLGRSLVYTMFDLC